jgi:hypothetical protein
MRTLALVALIGCASQAPRRGQVWTLIVLPDTQVYAERHPEIFPAQARRIAENALSKNICFVAHVGAVVEHNNHDVVEHNNHQEWSIAQRAFSLIPVPFANAPGNYDFRPDGTASTRDTLLHSYLREEIGHPVVS